MTVNDTTTLFIGGIVLVIAGVFIKQWFIKFINKKFDDIYSRQEQNEKEREFDNYMTLMGQQITCECLHQLNVAMIKGDNVEEIRHSNDELDKYRALLNKTIVEKASKYNIHIEH